MEQPAGRALVQEMIDEALSFRRAMSAVKDEIKSAWWFDIWQPDAIATSPTARREDWPLKPGARGTASRTWPRITRSSIR